jgi:hypothetical protein
MGGYEKKGEFVGKRVVTREQGAVERIGSSRKSPKKPKFD